MKHFLVKFLINLYILMAYLTHCCKVFIASIPRFSVVFPMVNVQRRLKVTALSACEIVPLHYFKALALPPWIPEFF